MKQSAFAFCVVFLLTASSAFASPIEFLSGLSGNWAGSGKAYLRGLGNVPASCNFKIGGSQKTASMNGSCGVFLFRAKLGLRLQNTSGTNFQGVYTGSRTGPAALAGMLKDSRLPMAITWGGEVNGDRNAEMILTRTGANSFSLAVFDQVSGERRQTSRFTFKKK